VAPSRPGKAGGRHARLADPRERQRSESALALIAKYRERPTWQLGDAIARTMTPAEHGDVVQLCADASAGDERQMLVYALWRIKTDEARSLIRDLVRDPSVAKHAMYSARRAFGNEEASQSPDRAPRGRSGGRR
jgi:hypothetical protein